MKELLEELKYNQKFNREKGLENRVDIDYMIDRLSSINACLELELENKILREIEYMLKTTNRFLEITDKSKDVEIIKQHLIALGQSMALADLKYSITYDSWKYNNKKEIK